MTDREIDDVLGGEVEIEPSQGFAASVMQAVRREAATPPPIRFPWLCALPGLLAWGITLAVVLGIPWFESGTRPAPAFHFQFEFSTMVARLAPLLDALRQFQAGWIALAILLTVVCVSFSFRLVRGGFRN